ncbi:hypothetical protein MAIT1_00429 [Magnetofaba australis IT-1]|uniref:Uncharacterized protein n=1 Tax=Magnetofaba australis IT-1 TaxID=1434232 RepID=A0A1Y2JZU3_9PROT|nr:hypothetical protein MAIT1_00429 [Magnetofaba australis IT-1]
MMEWAKEQANWDAIVSQAVGGNAMAQAAVGHCYLTGKLGDKSCDIAYNNGVAYYEKAYHGGQNWVLNPLVTALVQGPAGSSFVGLRSAPMKQICALAAPVQQRNIPQLLEGANRGLMGLCFLKGIGVETDKNYGVNLLDSAAKEGSIVSAHILDDIFRRSRYGVAINVERADFYQELAKKNALAMQSTATN